MKLSYLGPLKNKTNKDLLEIPSEQRKDKNVFRISVFHKISNFSKIFQYRKNIKMYVVQWY